MIAVSSYRPFGQAEEVDHLQLAAKASWNKIFERICYLSPPDDRLNPAEFIGTDPQNPKPGITSLAWVASGFGNPWAVLINADIQLLPKAKGLPAQMEKANANCGFSLRAVPGVAGWPDLGLDFFIATKEIWQRCALEFHPSYRIGVSMWDTSMLGWLSSNFPEGIVDLSPSRMVIHPNHGNRNDQHMDKVTDDPWFTRVKWPKRRIVF